MRILLVSNVFPPGFLGGYELGAAEVAQALASLGHSVTIVTSDTLLDESREVSAQPVQRILTAPPFSHELGDMGDRRTWGSYFVFHNLRRLAHCIRTTQADLVLLFNIQALGALSILRFLSAIGMPTVLYLMDNPLLHVDRSSPASRQYEAIFGPTDLGEHLRYIAMSNNVMQEFSASLGQDRAPDLVVPGWFHLNQANSKDLSSSNSHVRFVFCAQVSGHKGVDLVVDAAEALVRDGSRNFSIDFYGAGQVTQLLSSIRSRGLDQYARYAGLLPKADMVNAFSDYDALLFPTWEREPFGFVVSEAAAAGCIPIMTAGIGACDWFVHELDCLKIRRSALGLSNAMFQIIAMSPEQRFGLRRSAMLNARENLQFSRWMPLIEKACCQAATLPADRARNSTKGVLAAFQFLGNMWKESLRH